MSSENVKRLTVYGLLIALAFVFSYIESLIPFQLIVPVPGFKIGLANIVIVMALYSLGGKAAFSISIIRILLVAFTFSNLGTMMYSLAGGLLSCVVMILLKRIKVFSVVGVSVAGGVSHNIGQIIMIMIILRNTSMLYYLPILLLTGAVTGVFIGIAGALVVKRINISIK